MAFRPSNVIYIQTSTHQRKYTVHAHAILETKILLYHQECADFRKPPKFFEEGHQTIFMKVFLKKKNRDEQPTLGLGTGKSSPNVHLSRRVPGTKKKDAKY
jgi:hypothetical protein